MQQLLLMIVIHIMVFVLVVMTFITEIRMFQIETRCQIQIEILSRASMQR